MIKESVTQVLSKAMNAYLQLDSDTPSRLSALSGKIIAITWQPPGVTLYFQIESNQVHVLSHWEGPIDTTITGGPISMLQMGMSEQASVGQLMSGQVTMEGDVHSGELFSQLLKDMNIPWQRHLATMTGDMFAHQVFQGLRGLQRWAGGVSESMQANVTEYLQEETHQLPPREALQDFFFRY